TFNANADVLLNPAIAISGTSLTIQGTGNGNLVLAGPISGTGGLNVNTSTSNIAQVFLTSRANTYTGTTTVGTGGTLYLAANSAIDRRSAVTVDGLLFLNPSGSLPAGVTAGNYDQRLASLAGTTGVLDLG